MARHSFLLLTLAAALTITSLLTGCSNGGDVVLPTNTPGTYRSAPIPMGNGTGRSYVVIGADGNPTEVGAVITATALDNLPPGVKTLFELPLPPQASATPFNHIEMRYWSHGHDPQDLFAVEHFDFIPFLISQQERDKITAVGDDIQKVLLSPRIEAIPVGFAPIPPVDEFYSEPRYGTRYFDVANFTPVLNKEVPYTTTLFYGYYNGQVDFLEIPVTVPFLKQNGNNVLPVTLPREVPKSGYYPTRYRIAYDATTQEYIFALEGLVQR